MKHQTGRLSKSVAAAAVSLLFATAAHAVVYPASYDPGGNGNDIPGFNGTAVFDIDASCVPVGFTGWQPTSANTGSGSCGAASLLSANVTLYSTLTSDPPSPGVPLGSFSLGPAGLGVFDVLGVYVVNGTLAGVDTDPLGSVPGTGAYVLDDFWLQFVSGFCEFGCRPVPPMVPPPGDGGELFLSTKAPGDPAYIFVNNLFNPSFPATVVFGAPCPNDNPANCVFPVFPSQVPEPGILGLILGALGGSWLARRRRRPG